jgi:hypothetical protein
VERVLALHGVRIPFDMMDTVSRARGSLVSS